MILGCSRGCRFDTRNVWYRELQPGERCREVIDYDRMSGSTYCRRILREIKEEIVTPTPNTAIVTYQQDNEQVIMHLDATRGPDNLVGLAIREASRNTGGPIPALTFHGEPVAQSLFEQFMAAFTGGGLITMVAPEGTTPVDIDEDLGVWKNIETGKLEVWIDAKTVFGGEFPDTEDGLIAAAQRAQEMREGRV